MQFLYKVESLSALWFMSSHAFFKCPSGPLYVNDWQWFISAVDIIFGVFVHWKKGQKILSYVHQENMFKISVDPTFPN